MRRLGLFLLISGILAATPVFADDGAVLFVAPQRLVFAPAERTGTLSVANKSKQERRYDVSIVEQVMGPDGVTERKETAPYSIKSMTRFVPKRFTLKPGEQQTVRIAVSRPADLVDGDYHSHLMFREVPLGPPEKKEEPAADKPAEKTVSFDIQTFYGLGVPVVVQKGKIASDIGFSGEKIARTPDGKRRVLSIDFTRTGNAEAVGKLKVDYAQDGKAPVSLIVPQWVHVYHEVDKITKVIPLNNLPDDAKGGKIFLSLVRDEADDSKTIKKEITLP